MESLPIMEGENFRGAQQNFGYKDIVLRQVQKIANIYSRELTKGFYKKTQPNQAGQQEIVAYIPDGRESFINAVRVLHDLLLSKFDDDMNDNDKDIQKRIDSEHKIIEERQDKEGVGLREEWLKIEVNLMREMFQKLCLLLERLGWLAETSEED